MYLEKLPLTWFINFLFIGYNTFFVVDRLLNIDLPFAYLIKCIPILRYWRTAVFSTVSQKRNFPFCLLISIKRIKIRVKGNGRGYNFIERFGSYQMFNAVLLVKIQAWRNVIP